MTKTFLAAASALALMTGVAAAQNAPQDTQTPPAGQQEQAKPSTDQMNTGAAAGAGQSTAGAAQQPDKPAGQSSDTAEKPAEAAAPSTDTAEKPGDAMKKPSSDTAATPSGAGAASTDTAEKPGDAMEKPSSDTAATPSGADAPSTETAEQPDMTTTPSTDTAGAEATQSEEAIESADTGTETEDVSGPPVSMRDMMGQTVLGSDGESIGEVYDVVVDSGTGEIKQVVIASGGFLGLGEKQVVVDYKDLEVQPGAGIAASDLTQASIEAMEEFDVSSMTESLDAETPPPAAGGGGMATPTPAPAQ